jgi:hypothetical protein
MTPPRVQNFFKEARKGTAAISLFLFLALQAMADVPALHAMVHHDADDPSHQCAVTLFLHGQVHTSSPVVAPTRPASVFAFERLPRSADFTSADVLLLPCRGPPDLRSVI